MSEFLQFDLSKYPTKRVAVKNLVSAINPRTDDELDIPAMIPEIVRYSGQIIEPILAWLPDENAPIRKIVTIPDKGGILIRGHRRCGALNFIRENKSTFLADVWGNAEFAPVIMVTGITEEFARDLAMDEGSKKGLLVHEVILDVFRRFRNDHTYQKVVESQSSILYKALLTGNSEAKYRETLKLDSGKDRLKKQLTDLRNWVDQWLQSAYLLGRPIEDQVVTWARKNRDKRSLREGERLLFDAKYPLLQKLRSVYTNSRDENWSPITSIDMTDNGVVVIEGGNTEVNKMLTAFMEDFRNPEKAKENKIALPKTAERENVKTSSRSDLGKLYSAFFCGEDSDGRSAADDRVYFMEQREKVLRELHDALVSPVKDLVKAILDEKDMAKFKDAFFKVDGTLFGLEEASKAVKEVRKPQPVMAGSKKR